MLTVLYGIKLKWEAEGAEAVWGISTVTFGLSFGLRRKGAVIDLDSEVPEWDRWLGVGSTNSKQTCRSMFPTLLINSVWFSTTGEELRSNLRSLMWGIGVKGYLEPWWRGQLLQFFKDNQLDRIVTIKDLFAWVREGKDHHLALPFRNKQPPPPHPRPPSTHTGALGNLTS